jgi:hypothetical protein
MNTRMMQFSDKFSSCVRRNRRIAVNLADNRPRSVHGVSGSRTVTFRETAMIEQ